jgi:hypothetical protein
MRRDRWRVSVTGSAVAYQRRSALAVPTATALSYAPDLDAWAGCLARSWPGSFRRDERRPDGFAVSALPDGFAVSGRLGFEVSRCQPLCAP